MTPPTDFKPTVEATVTTPTTVSDDMADIPALQWSTQVRTQTKSYQPLMKGKSYNYSAAQFEQSTHQHDPRVVKLVMTQLSLKAAIKACGNKARVAAKAKMKQLHWRNSFRPVTWNELSKKKKKTVLESHIFIKQKRTGEVKGRTVAGGNKLHDYIDKEDASLPTVATESVILTSIIDAYEQ